MKLETRKEGPAQNGRREPHKVTPLGSQNVRASETLTVGRGVTKTSSQCRKWRRDPHPATPQTVEHSREERPLREKEGDAWKGHLPGCSSPLQGAAYTRPTQWNPPPKHCETSRRGELGEPRLLIPQQLPNRQLGRSGDLSDRTAIHENE